VPGEGAENAEIMFVGEGPGFHEDQQGRPFIGAAGKFLDELLGSINLTRADVYICNVVKCRPPSNRDPSPEEVDACRPFLLRQIELINHWGAFRSPGSSRATRSARCGAACAR